MPNPEGINQYTKGGAGKAAAKASADAHKFSAVIARTGNDHAAAHSQAGTLHQKAADMARASGNFAAAHAHDGIAQQHFQVARQRIEQANAMGNHAEAAKVGGQVIQGIKQVREQSEREHEDTLLRKYRPQDTPGLDPGYRGVSSEQRRSILVAHAKRMHAERGGS